MTGSVVVFVAGAAATVGVMLAVLGARHGHGGRGRRRGGGAPSRPCGPLVGDPARAAGRGGG